MNKHIKKITTSTLKVDNIYYNYILFNICIYNLYKEICTLVHIYVPLTIKLSIQIKTLGLNCAFIAETIVFSLFLMDA